jgi:predicted porin
MQSGRHRFRARLARLLGYGIAVSTFAASAQADGISLDSMKDVSIPSVTAAGVTIYGTIDVGGAYTTHGVPASGAFYVGSDYTIFGSRYAERAIGTITNNALSQSVIGVKIEESFGDGWVGIGKLETGFNPISGELADACASLVRNSGKLYSQMDVNGDGSRCGQAFNSQAYGGVSNASYGTLTLGRQNSLELDGLANYDPMALGYAFSILGYSGTPAAGIGSTETARWDNSVKYIYQYGPLHAAGMFTAGGQDTPMFGQGYAANIGGAYRGFSIDGFYTREYSVVNAASFTNPAYASTPHFFPAGTNCVAAGEPGVPVCPYNELVGTITDNQAWSVMAKYSFDIGEPLGGMKDQKAETDKLTFFAGFVWIDLSNPDHAQSFYNGYNTIGGYILYTLGGTNGLLPGQTNYSALADRAFGSDRYENTEWAGVRYDFLWGLSLTAAYYHWGQDNFLDTGNRSCATNTVRIATGQTTINNRVGAQIPSNCAGDFNQVSFLADYVFNKHFDVYGGVSYTEIGGGLASAFLNKDMFSAASGVRLKF